jgi:hypothetical protein
MIVNCVIISGHEYWVTGYKLEYGVRLLGGAAVPNGCMTIQWGRLLSPGWYCTLFSIYLQRAALPPHSCKPRKLHSEELHNMYHLLNILTCFCMRYVVHTLNKMLIVVFKVATPWGIGEGYFCFGGTSRLFHSPWKWKRYILWKRW